MVANYNPNLHKQNGENELKRKRTNNYEGYKNQTTVHEKRLMHWKSARQAFDKMIKDFLPLQIK